MTRNVGGRQQYSMESHGAPTARSGNSGWRILQQHARVSQWSPSWKNTHTIFRPFPRFNRETNQFDPMLNPNSTSELNFTDFVRRYTATMGVGPAKISYFEADPTQQADGSGSPMWALVRAAKTAVKTGVARPEWLPYIVKTDANNHLPEPADLYLAQGWLFEHNNKPCATPIGFELDKPPLLFTMKNTAGSEFLRACKAKDANGQLITPDAVDLVHGKFFDFRQAGTPSRNAPAAQMGGPAPLQIAAGKSSMRYEVEALDGSNISNYADVIRSRWMEYDEILWFPTVAEQVHLLCQSGLPPTFLAYGLSDQFGQYLPESVRTSLRTQMAAPDMSNVSPQYPQGSPPVPAGFVPQSYGQPQYGAQPTAPSVPAGFTPPLQDPSQQAYGQQPYGQPPAYGQQPHGQQSVYGPPMQLTPPTQSPPATYQPPGMGYGAQPGPAGYPPTVAPPAMQPPPAGYQPPGMQPSPSGPAPSPQGYVPPGMGHAAPPTVDPALSAAMQPMQPSQPAVQATQGPLPNPPTQPTHTEAARRDQTLDALRAAEARAR